MAQSLAEFARQVGGGSVTGRVCQTGGWWLSHCCILSCVAATSVSLPVVMKFNLKVSAHVH